MAVLQKYVGFCCPDLFLNGAIQWTDIYEGQADFSDPVVDIKLEMYEIKAESVSEARRKLFSALYKSWDNSYELSAIVQILSNVCDMSDPDNFEEEYIEFFGEKDGSVLITIVNENYDNYQLDEPVDFYFNTMTESSKIIFKELSDQTKMELLYDALKSELMIYPLKRV